MGWSGPCGTLAGGRSPEEDHGEVLSHRFGRNKCPSRKRLCHCVDEVGTHSHFRYTRIAACRETGSDLSTTIDALMKTIFALHPPTLSWLTASVPFRTGIKTSSMRISGVSLFAASITACPFVTLPTTSKLR